MVNSRPLLREGFSVLSFIHGINLLTAVPQQVAFDIYDTVASKAFRQLKRHFLGETTI